MNAANLVMSLSASATVAAPKFVLFSGVPLNRHVGVSSRSVWNSSFVIHGRATVPQRGQCVHAASNGVLQEAQLRGADVSLSSASPEIPFLNSCIDFPSERAISGSRLAPKKKRTRASPTRRSWLPIIAILLRDPTQSRSASKPPTAPPTR